LEARQGIGVSWGGSTTESPLWSRKKANTRYFNKERRFVWVKLNVAFVDVRLRNPGNTGERLSRNFAMRSVDGVFTIGRGLFWLNSSWISWHGLVFWKIRIGKGGRGMKPCILCGKPTKYQTYDFCEECFGLSIEEIEARYLRGGRSETYEDQIDY
jgi:hypothetical protein